MPTRVLLMRVPQMPFDQFRNAVMGPAGIRLCRTPLLRSGTEEDITRHQTCQSYAAAQIDEALYLRTIRPAFGTFHGRMGEALTPPNCQMRNAHEQVCSSSVDGPAGVRWIVDRTGGQHRVVEVTQWSVNDG